MNRNCHIPKNEKDIRLTVFKAISTINGINNLVFTYKSPNPIKSQNKQILSGFIYYS